MNKPLHTPQASKWREILAGGALAVFGVGVALGMIAFMLQALPHLRPGAQRFIFTELDGDTFRHQPGMVRPPAQNRILEDVTRFDDADGFRQPARVAGAYPIVGIGDSFTDGGQFPWTDVLAERLNTPVRNLGWSGFGPLEYAAIARDYLQPENRHVLIAYFEGNDLSNIMTTYQRAQAEGGGTVTLDLTRNIAPPILDIRAVEDYIDIFTREDDNYLYPLTHPTLNGLELAYISDYLWWLNGDADIFRQSQNAQLLAGALSEIVEYAGDGACVALIYIPIKGHVYFPLSDPDGNRRYVLENARELALSADGWLTFHPPQPLDMSTFEARMGNQRDVVQEIAEGAGVQFWDMLPALTANRLIDGEALYYTYDSHLNTRGHAVIGAEVAERIHESACGHFAAAR